MPLYGQNVWGSDWGQRLGHDVVSRDVPARGEARLVQHQGAGGVRDDSVAGADDEVAGRVADVDAVVRVGGVPEDALVLLVEARPSHATPARPCR